MFFLQIRRLVLCHASANVTSYCGHEATVSKIITLLIPVAMWKPPDFPSFPCVYKQTLRWFPRFQVASTCFSCSPPDLNLLVTNFMFCIHVK